MKSPKNHRIKTSFQAPDSSNQQPAASFRPFIVPIFLPHAGCPHQCVFCNQVSITGSIQKTINADQIKAQIHQFLEYKNNRRKPVQISFYGGNFLGLKTGEIQSLLELATGFVNQGHADSIRFSTRPDTITPQRLDFISKYPVETIELGVQSMDDQVLALARRGHSAADTTRAVHRLKEHKFNIGLQMMVGLPGDTETLSFISAQKIAALQPDFVRVYPTIVVKNSLLARWYQDSAYVPLSLEEAVSRVTILYRYFTRHNIKIIRMGLQASADLADGSTVLAGPYHPAFGHMVFSKIFLDAACTAIKAANYARPSVAIFVNPRRVSTMRGLKNANVELIKSRFGFDRISIVPDNNIEENSVKIDNENPTSCFVYLDN